MVYISLAGFHTLQIKTKRAADSTAVLHLWANRSSNHVQRERAGVYRNRAMPSQRARAAVKVDLLSHLHYLPSSLPFPLLQGFMLVVMPAAFIAHGLPPPVIA